jgi:bacteriorhodopsin
VPLMISSFIQLAFAGVWEIVWSLGIGVGLIVCCIAAAILSPIGKGDFIAAACAVALFLFAESIGIHLEAKHVAAQQQVIAKDVDTAVTQAKNSKGWKDKWDNPQN